MANLKRKIVVDKNGKSLSDNDYVDYKGRFGKLHITYNPVVNNTRVIVGIEFDCKKDIGEKIWSSEMIRTGYWDSICNENPVKVPNVRKLKRKEVISRRVEAAL